MESSRCTSCSRVSRACWVACAPSEGASETSARERSLRITEGGVSGWEYDTGIATVLANRGHTETTGHSRKRQVVHGGSRRAGRIPTVPGVRLAGRAVDGYVGARGRLRADDVDLASQQERRMSERRPHVVAAVGLVLGALLGMAGTFVPS